MEKSSQNYPCGLRRSLVALSGQRGDINDAVKIRGISQRSTLIPVGQLFEHRFVEEVRRPVRIDRIARADNDVGAEGAEFSGEAALGIDLEIEERRRDGCARAEGEQNHKQAPAIGAEQTTNNAPEHLSVEIGRA